MKKLSIYLGGALALLLVWCVWLVVRPEAKEIRVTRTFITVNAPTDRVWQALTNVGDYPRWNPYVTSAAGNLGVGAKLNITGRVGGRDHSHSVRVVEYRPEERLLVWRGGLLPTALLHWDERFQVNSADSDRSEVTVTRSYQGVLLPLYWKLFNAYDLDAIHKMGSALKARCEK